MWRSKSNPMPGRCFSRASAVAARGPAILLGDRAAGVGASWPWPVGRSARRGDIQPEKGGESSWLVQGRAMKGDKSWVAGVESLCAQVFFWGCLFDVIDSVSAETSPVYRRRVKLNMAVAVFGRSTSHVGAPSQNPVLPTISSVHHVIIRKHVKIATATINLTTLATRLLGKPTWWFQAIQETRKHARKNLWARDEPPEHRPRTWGRRPSVADPSHPGLLPTFEPGHNPGTEANAVIGVRPIRS